jgi:predicted RNase H-like HicB family nuclease
MTIKIEIDREDDGRFIADAVDYPGTMAYGYSREDAIGRVKALVLHVLADKMIYDGLFDVGDTVTFEVLP